MNTIIKLLVVTFIIVACLFGCRHIKPKLDVTSVHFSDIIGQSENDYRYMSMKLTLLPKGYGGFYPDEISPNYLLKTQDATLTIEDFVVFQSIGIDYSTDELYVLEKSYSAKDFMIFIEAIKDNQKFMSNIAHSRSALSVTFVKQVGHRNEKAELFINFEHVHEFAKTLTNTSLGSESLIDLIQWEMNL